MNHFLQDVRFALRQLRRAPGFTLAAVLTLALGIAALATVFTWLKAVLYNPFPRVQNPRALRFVDATVRESQGYSVHYEQVEFLRQRYTSLEDQAAFDFSPTDVSTPGGAAETVSTGLVSSNYFRLLGMSPQVGRFFDPNANDRVYGSHDEVVLSDSYWHSHLSSDPRAVGQVIQINRHPFTVIGVAPQAFTGIYGGIAEDMWLPLSASRSLQADAAADPLKNMGLMMAGRLRPGVTPEAAAAELHKLAQEYEHQKNFTGWDLNLRDSAHFARGLIGTIGDQLPILFGASVLLLILVCVNTASLLGQRAARRSREIAIRTSLGATSRRIARQLLVESLLLALGGGAVGWAASVALARSLYVILPAFGARIVLNLDTDWRVLGFVGVLVLAVALLCGMMPVRQALRGSQKDALREGGQAILGAGRKRHVKTAVLGLQLGLCFVVLASSALLTRTMINILNNARGFDRENTMTASLALSRSGYTEQRGRALQWALLEQLRSAPGVVDATLTSHLPMGDYGSGNTWNFDVPGYKFAPDESKSVVTDLEGPTFFRTMRIALAQGREFTDQDREGTALVAVVNEDMARRYWPKGNALGSTVTIDKKPVQVVGIVKNYAYHNPSDTDPNPVLYLPTMQHYQGHVFVAVRSRTSEAAVVPVLRGAVAKLDGALPLGDVQSLVAVTETIYEFSRIPAELIGVYALASLLVASLGLYAVMAYSVTERNREFALRMAVGATRAQIVRLVVGGGLQTVAVGLAIGGIGSFFAVKLLRSVLFGVGASDPLSFAGAGVVLVLTVLVAGLAPARRAATVQPMQVLKTE
ncbi:MAG TPA: ABC transporter permease [Terracidiphilus sp.]|jgi:predicted permease